MPWTLIAHPDADLRGEIQNTLQATLGPWAGRMVQARHAQEAAAAFVSNNKDVCRLVIVATELPDDAATPLAASKPWCGLETVRQLRPPKVWDLNETGGPFFVGHAVFIAHHVDTVLLHEIQQLAPSEFVTLGADWIEKLKQLLPAIQAARAARALPAAAQLPRPRGLNLDLELLKQWKWHIGGGGVEDTGDFYVDPRKLSYIQDLGSVFSEQHDSRNWEKLFGVISGQLNDLFFSNPLNKVSLLQSILQFGSKNARVRFIVDDTTHDLLLEALQDPDETDARQNQTSYWALKAPIYRRYDRRGENYPLFKDPQTRSGKINCLIVVADPAECTLGQPWNTPLEGLLQLENEAKAVKDILEAEQARPDGCVEHVEVFRASGHRANADSLVEELTKLLERNPWHLVHFVGHAVQLGGKGALVLDGRQGAVLPADVLADLLANAHTQFLYLSSCKSADAYFVMRLVERRVPAVLGFRWPVRDESALACAKQYYSALFTGPTRKYLEYALLVTKQKLHQAARAKLTSDSIWAAPVLVMQVDKAQQDESPFHAGTQPAAAPQARPALH
jgi:hypothetical protein